MCSSYRIVDLIKIEFIMSVRRAAGFLIFRRIQSDIEYLLLKASYGQKHWTPPKGEKLIQVSTTWQRKWFHFIGFNAGHVDPGEDDFTTALRETREEAGYTADDLHIHKDEQKVLNYKVKGNDKTVIYWLAELRDLQKDPILSDEHTEFRWLKKDDAISLSGYADFAAMVNHFHDRIVYL